MGRGLYPGLLPVPTHYSFPSFRSVVNLEQFVPKYYSMDPTKDKLIFGYQLVTGMTVLLEYDEKRVQIQENMHDGQLQIALHVNRWCVVQKLVAATENYNRMSFIGLYDDGTERSFTFDRLTTWYVKSDFPN